MYIKYPGTTKWLSSNSQLVPVSDFDIAQLPRKGQTECPITPENFIYCCTDGLMGTSDETGTIFFYVITCNFCRVGSILLLTQYVSHCPGYQSMSRSVSKFQPMHVSIICLSSFLSFKSVVSEHCKLLKHKLVLLNSVLRKC